MKRNMDLIRFLLRELEAQKPDSVYKAGEAVLPGNNPPGPSEIAEHCRLIVERGLARGEPSFSGWILTGLTWAGHDFLDNSRESAVWRAAKKAAGNLSFDVFVRVLTEAAVRYAMAQLGSF